MSTGSVQNPLSVGDTVGLIISPNNGSIFHATTVNYREQYFYVLSMYRDYGSIPINGFTIKPALPSQSSQIYYGQIVTFGFNNTYLFNCSGTSSLLGYQSGTIDSPYNLDPSSKDACNYFWIIADENGNLPQPGNPLKPVSYDDTITIYSFTTSSNKDDNEFMYINPTGDFNAGGTLSADTMSTIGNNNIKIKLQKIAGASSDVVHTKAISSGGWVLILMLVILAGLLAYFYYNNVR